MKLSMMINYISDFQSSAKQVVELEKVGLDMVWVAEAYSYDSISQIGYLAAVTNKLEIGTGIINVYSRTASLTAMTAAGCDYVSNGRFILGLGASGPQVVEGFHGVAYEKPMQRIKEYIEVCREVWKREKGLSYTGQTVQVPLPAGQGRWPLSFGGESSAGAGPVTPLPARARDRAGRLRGMMATRPRI